MTTKNAASIITTVVVSTAASLIVIRAIKRSFSPEIKAKLKCRCGKVQGEVCAKKEDSLRLYCYCRDCQAYAQFINNESSVLDSSGASHLVQVCKSDVVIEQGQEWIKLARKAPNIGMFRFYASCCRTPLVNAYPFLGLVGVLEDTLDSEKEKFSGQWCFCPHEESGKIPVEKKLPDFPTGQALWNMFRYLPWAKSGPFDYSLEPVYWGDVKKTELVPIGDVF